MRRFLYRNGILVKYWLMNKICSLTALLFFSAILSALAADNMKAFPPASEGMVRYVLQLPKQDDESAYKVELIVGKMVQANEGNKYFYTGKIEEETISGWGFPRYNVNTLGQLAGTLMASMPETFLLTPAWTPSVL